MTLIPRNETSTRRRAGSFRATARVEVAVMAATAGAPVNNQNAAGDWLTAFPHYVASLWAADELLDESEIDSRD